MLPRTQKSKTKPTEKILITCNDLIECPYCRKEIISADAVELGECEHLVCIHLPSYQKDGLEFAKDSVFKGWWNEQPWKDLYDERDDDPQRASAFGRDNLDAKMVRVLQAYAACPHVDVLIEQEDQGTGAFSSVLFGFRKG